MPLDSRFCYWTLFLGLGLCDEILLQINIFGYTQHTSELDSCRALAASSVFGVIKNCIQSHFNLSQAQWNFSIGQLAVSGRDFSRNFEIRWFLTPTFKWEGIPHILDMHFEIVLTSKRGRFWLGSIQWAVTLADAKKEDRKYNHCKA